MAKPWEQFQAQRAPDVDEQPSPTTAQSVGRLGRAGLQGLNEGILRTGELPYDIVNNLPRLLNLLPGEQGVGKISEMAEGIPVLGDLFRTDDPLVEIGKAAGITGTVQPETSAERVASRVGQELGMTLLPQVGITQRAATLPREIGAMNNANMFDRAVTLPFRDSPGKANAAEAAVAAGAGAGAGLARETINDDETTDLAGALAGGTATAGALGAGSSIVRSLENLFSDIGVRQGVGEQLVRSSADPNAAFSENTINRAGELENTIPGVKPSTGQSSGDSGVLALEYSRSTGGPNIGRFQQRQADNNAALRDTFDGVAPNVADDAKTREVLTERRDSAVNQADRVTAQRQQRADEAAGRGVNLETQRTAAQRDFEEAYADIASQRALRQSGSEGISDAYQAARENVGSERRAVFVAAQEQGQNRVSSEPFETEARAILGELGPLADTASDPALSRLVRDIERLAPEADAPGGIVDASGRPIEGDTPQFGEVSIADIIDMQPRLSRAMRTANSTMRGDTVKALSRLDETMRNVLQDAADAGDTGAQKWLEANKLSAEEAPLFRRGTGGKMDKQARRNDDAPDSAVGSRFIRPDTSPGAAESATQLRQIIDRAPDPQAARASVRDYTVGALADKISGRKPTVKSVDDFIREHSAALKEFPEVRKELTQMRNRLDSQSSKIGELENDITAAAAETKAAQQSTSRAQSRRDKLDSNLNSDNTVIGRYLNRETGKDSMKRVLAANKPVEEAEKLMKAVRGDPDAEDGVRRAFFDLMDDSVSSTRKDVNDNPLFKKDAFIKFLNRNDEVAKKILGPTHAKDLRKIASELDVLQRTSNAKPAGSSGTAAGNQGSGITLNSLLSRFYGIQRGVVSPRFVASELLTRQIAAVSRKLKAKDIDSLLDDALLDPQLARTLTMEFSKENDRLLTKRMPAVLARLGARGGRANAVSEDDRDDEADDNETDETDTR